MSTPIEALAQESAEDYVEQGWFKLEYSSFGQTAKECKQAHHNGFIKGAKAASGRVAELEAALDKLLGAVKCYNSHKPGYCVVCDVVETRKALSGAGKGEGHE